MVDNKIVEPALLRISLALLLIRTHLAGNHWKNLNPLQKDILLSQMRKIPLEDLRFVGLMSIIDPP